MPFRNVYCLITELLERAEGMPQLHDNRNVWKFEVQSILKTGRFAFEIQQADNWVKPINHTNLATSKMVQLLQHKSRIRHH